MFNKCCLTLILSYSFFCFSEHIVIEETSGETHVIEFQPTDSFLSVMESIETHIQSKSETNLINEPVQSSDPIKMIIKRLNRKITVNAAKVPPRDYYRFYSPQEKNDLHELLKSLSEDSLLTLGFSKKSLQQISNRLFYLHPFQTLVTILNDPQLTHYIHKIRQRGVIWNDLFDQFSNALNEENRKANLLPFTNDFAYQVDLDEVYILPSLRDRDWLEFFDTLLATHPI